MTADDRCRTRMTTPTAVKISQGGFLAGRRPSAWPSLSVRLRLRPGCLAAQAEQVAGRKHEIGAVERIEVELAHAFIDEVGALLGGDRRGDEVRGLLVVSRPSNLRASQAGTLAPVLRGKARHLLEVMDRHDARQDRAPDAGRAAALDEAQIVRVVEEELRDDARRAGVDLALQMLDVDLRATRSRDASPDSRRPRRRSRRSCAMPATRSDACA